MGLIGAAPSGQRSFCDSVSQGVALGSRFGQPRWGCMRPKPFEAIGKVLKAGKTLTVCMGEVFSWKGGKLELIAAMQATMIAVAV